MKLRDKITECINIEKDIISEFKVLLTEKFDGDLWIDELGLENIEVTFADPSKNNVSLVVGDLYNITIEKDKLYFMIEIDHERINIYEHLSFNEIVSVIKIIVDNL